MIQYLWTFSYWNLSDFFFMIKLELHVIWGRIRKSCAVFFMYHGGFHMAYPLLMCWPFPLCWCGVYYVPYCKVAPTTLVMHYASWDEVNCSPQLKMWQRRRHTNVLNFSAWQICVFGGVVVTDIQPFVYISVEVTHIYIYICVIIQHYSI